MAELVSRTYALALFEAGLELEKTEKFKENLDFLARVFSSEEKLLDILNHPRIKKSEKKEIVDNIFKESLEKELINFLYILIDKRREDEILNIVDQFEKLYNDHKNIVKVTAVTAVKMDQGAMERLSDSLGKKLNKAVILQNEIDSSLLGGVLLKMDNKIIDGSIKGRLNDIGKFVGVAN